MKIAYHITEPKNLAGIYREGIRCADRANFLHLQGKQKPCVWVFLRDYDAVWWGKFHHKIYGEFPVIIRLDVEGYELKEDYKLITFFESYYIEHDIPADRIFHQVPRKNENRHRNNPARRTTLPNLR